MIGAVKQRLIKMNKYVVKGGKGGSHQNEVVWNRGQTAKGEGESDVNAGLKIGINTWVVCRADMRC